MGLGEIFDKIKDAVTGNNNDEAQNVDAEADPAYDDEQGIQPASQDPYGDPGTQGEDANSNDAAAGILPASQDPYGDPADQQ